MTREFPWDHLVPVADQIPTGEPVAVGDLIAEIVPTWVVPGSRDEAIMNIGLNIGYRRGYQEAEAAHACSHHKPKYSPGPARDVSGDEARMWGAAGRRHFADPRPGDFVPAASQDDARTTA